MSLILIEDESIVILFLYHKNIIRFIHIIISFFFDIFSCFNFFHLHYPSLSSLMFLLLVFLFYFSFLYYQMVLAQKNKNDNEKDNMKTVHINMVLSTEISERVAKFCNRLANHIASISNIGE